MRRNEESLSTKLRRIDELAEKDQRVRFTSLAHLLNEEMLTDSYKKLNRKGAPGTDGVSIGGFGEQLEENIKTLYEELGNIDIVRMVL